MFGSYEAAIGFATIPLSDHTGFTWTLTSLMGKFLAELEETYGSRDRDYTPLGIEFHGDRPQVWYPGNRKHAVVMLTNSARTNPNLAIFQLAHETVHLLSPSGGRNALVVEEGLATFFCESISNRFSLGCRSNAPQYAYAESLVKKLLDIEPNAIGQIRKVVPNFYEWTPDKVSSACPQVEGELAFSLCESFANAEARILAGG